ncbi:MAG: DHHW family protein [Acetatifactor sp.]
MSFKKHIIFAITVISSLFFVFAFADVVSEDEFAEKTMEAPSFLDALLSGDEAAETYDRYLLANFVSKEKWSDLQKSLQILFGKRQIDSVYLGKDGYLFEEHVPEAYPEQLIQEKLELAEKLVTEWNAKVMLVPTSDAVLSDKLPSSAPRLDQGRLSELAKELLGEDYIDVEETLREHREESYYRTDRSWTSYGAYYAYRVWAERMGISKYPYNLNIAQKASEDVAGSLQQQIGYGDYRDTFVYVRETLKRKVTLQFDFGKTSNSMYFPEWLDTDTPYSYYLDGPHAFTELAFQTKTGRKLFLIGGSYSKAFVPLLAQHYDRIYLLEPDRFGGDVDALISSCLKRHIGEAQSGVPSSKGTKQTDAGYDVLILYDNIEFLERFTWKE